MSKVKFDSLKGSNTEKNIITFLQVINNSYIFDLTEYIVTSSRYLRRMHLHLRKIPIILEFVF